LTGNKKISALTGFINFFAGPIFPKLSKAVGLQTNVDQSWNLAREILAGEASFYNFSESPFFTLHENVRFGSVTDMSAFGQKQTLKLKIIGG